MKIQTAITATLGGLSALMIASSALALDVRFQSGEAPKNGHVAIVIDNVDALKGAAASVDSASKGALKAALKSAGFKGDKGSSLTLHGVGGFERIVVVGAGRGALSQTDWEDIGARAAEGLKGKEGALVLGDTSAEAIASAALGARLSQYNYTAHKSDAPAKSKAVLSLVADQAKTAETTYNARHAAVAEGVILARDLISEPSNIKTPQWFVSRAQAALKGVEGVTLTVLDEKQMAEMGMGLIVGSGQGSSRPPRLLVMQYKGAGNAAPLALVGKGITFDSGGISIKPGENMWRMRYDMSGAAAVTGTLLAAAKSKAPVNLIAVAALSENMPDGNAIRPGDVLKAYNGTTVEIISTDAEGRLVMADANAWVQKQHKPHTVINIATLTGSARSTLGDQYAAVFANDDALKAALTQSGVQSGETLWPLPLSDFHMRDIRSDVADIINSGKSGTAGASTGAAFLKHFITPGTNWAHLDIAGVAWRDNPTPTTPRGAAGYGVRLFTTYIFDQSAKR
ncbi:MAG: leucyl aminopeptidase [Asticcacaulis sp.]